jgi:hypothetical protein
VPDQVVCILAFQANEDHEDESEVEEQSEEERAAMGHIWILGDPWFRHYYTVFDRAGSQMLAAPATAGCKPGVYRDPFSGEEALNLMRSEILDGEPPEPVLVDPERVLARPPRQLLPRSWPP